MRCNNMDDDNELKKLENTVWKTRTARIHSEKRCLAAADFYRNINLYYSCIVIALSILNYASFIEPYMKEKYGLLAINMSVCLMLSILKLNPERCKEYANSYRNNHIALQKLGYELAYRRNEINIFEYEKKYTDILNLCPNHTEQDYREGVYDNRYNDEIAWQRIKVSYYIGAIKVKVLHLFWCILPLFLIIIVYVV